RKELLQSLLRLAMDPMVSVCLMKERPGIRDIQKQAALELVYLLKEPRSDQFLDQVEFILLELLAEAVRDNTDEKMMDFSRAVLALSVSEDTLTLIEGVDALYIQMKNLTKVPDFDIKAFLLCEQKEAVNSESFIAEAAAELMRNKALNRQSNDHEDAMQGVADAEVVYLSQDQIDNMHKQVSHYCGSSYMEPYHL
ncbi:MAG: hypothetical protein RR614_05400, partial [Eubacterium sp.]